MIPIDAEATLAALTEAASDSHPGGLVTHLRSLVSTQWDPYRGTREDWPGIYNAWLLLGELYRLESFCHGAPPGTGRPRVGAVVRLLRYASFGTWCHVWGVSGLVDAARRWCETEKAGLRDPIGPSASLVESFLSGRPKAGAAIEWASVRKSYGRGGLKRPAVHCDFFPYDVLAPELAWCARSGQTVPRLSAITDFPDVQQWPVTSVTERALVAIGSSKWA